MIVVLIVLLLLTFVPIFLMFVVSLKSTGQLYTNFWALPNPPYGAITPWLSPASSAICSTHSCM